jgi:cbb3-type cytochrome oxidase subunit 3
LVAWLLCLFFYLKERRSVQLFLLLILGTGILLTFSRAVWVLWGIATVTSLVCLPELRNRRNLLKVGFTHILSCLTAALIKQDLLFFWHRVTSIQPDTAELQIRTVYWRDSLPIIRDYWWGGTGGGGWSLLQYGYQSKQYYVKYVHNHFLQMALDIGVVGLALFIILIVWFYFRAWKQGSNSLASKEQVYWFKSVVIVVSVILLHAGFDFDLSFPLVFGILLCLMSIVTDGDAVQVFKPSQIPFVLVGVVLIPLSLFSIFISFGYQQKEHGIRSAAEGRWDDAHQYFSRAKGLLPWSHSVSYESAKSYVLQGNLSRNLQDYHAAQMELEAAVKRAPLEKMYQDLMKDLEKVNH